MQIKPYREQVSESITRQEVLIADIQKGHQAFVNETGGGTGSRETFLSELASAYDNFTTLQNNLKEGTKFYNDLTQLLVVFQNKISDFCFARKTEKDELMKSLTEESSRMSSSAPSMPSYGSGGTSAGGSAPAAPPSSGQTPYPSQIQGMPVPYGATTNAPYPTYVAPMPQSFNPYATLPYPNTAYNYQHFPQGPQAQNYGTYPGAYSQQQQQQPGYPQQPNQGYPHPPGW